MIEKCGKMVFVKAIQKYKPCVNLKRHNGHHTGDLTGQKFGNIVVIKLGEPRKFKNRIRPTWIINQKGSLRTVCGHHLLSGKIASKKDISYLAWKRGVKNPEYTTVYFHYRAIFDLKRDNNKSYKGMPFFDDWNPDKGGAFWKGVEWIKNNLGCKPGPEWSIDVIDHQKGFVPGNLRWANSRTQSYNRRHKKLGLFTIQELRVECKRHGYKLVRI